MSNANQLYSNPIVISDWTRDIVLAVKGMPMVINKIVMCSATDGDIFVLKDAKGRVIAKIVQTGAGDTTELELLQRFREGVTIDVSDCTGMASTADVVWIYLI